MRSITTAAAFAIAASLVAGQGAGKSGKSGTKSSKSGDCIADCSTDSLTRANILTSLFFSNWAVDGEINQDSIVAYCAADDATKTEFARAVGNTVNFFEGQLFVDLEFLDALFFGGLSEGQALIGNVEGFCFAELLGLTEGCITRSDFELCDDCGPIPDPCDLLEGAATAALGIEASHPEKRFGFKSLLEKLDHN